MSFRFCLVRVAEKLNFSACDDDDPRDIAGSVQSYAVGGETITHNSTLKAMRAASAAQIDFMHGRSDMRALRLERDVLGCPPEVIACVLEH